MEILGFLPMVGKVEPRDGAGAPVVEFVLFATGLFFELFRKFFCVFEAGAPADGITVEVSESIEYIVDPIRITVECIERPDEYRFATSECGESIETEDEERGRTTRDACHEPFPFIEFGRMDEQFEWTADTLRDVTFEEGFGAEDDDSRDIADAIVDLRRYFVFGGIEFPVFRDDGAVEAYDDADRDDRREENDEESVEAEQGECDDGTDEAYCCLYDLKSVFGKIKQRPRSLFDLVNGIARMMIRMPCHREREGATEEILFVIRPNEEGISRLDDACRTMEHPKGDRLQYEERDEEEKGVKIFLRDALLLNGAEDLRDDERLEEGDDIGDDEECDEKDNLRTVAFRELPCFFPEIENRIIAHSGLFPCHEFPQYAQVDDENDDEDDIPDDESRVGKAIEVEHGGEEYPVPRCTGDRGPEPHGDETLFHEYGICENDRKERRLRCERIGTDGNGESMRDRIALRRVAEEEEYHPDTEEEVDGVEKSFLGIIDHPVGDGLVEERDGIGG